MDEAERREAGMAMRRAVLGDAHVDDALAQSDELSAPFQDLIARYAWGEIWTRPGLDPRTRRVLVLGTLIAQGRWDELKLHAAAALRPGVAGALSRAELSEIALQQAVYCGVPAARSAFETLREVIAQSPAPGPDE